MYQPVLLTAGAAFSFFSSDKAEADSFSWNEWATFKFGKSDGAILNEAKAKENAKVDTKPTAKAPTTPATPETPKKTTDGDVDVDEYIEEWKDRET